MRVVVEARLSRRVGNGVLEVLPSTVLLVLQTLVFSEYLLVLLPPQVYLLLEILYLTLQLLRVKDIGLFQLMLFGVAYCHLKLQFLGDRP